MGLVNRSVVLIRPSTAFANWLSSILDPQAAENAVNEARQDPTAYLVPEAEDAEDLEALLEESWPILCENELAIWVDDDTRWPKERSPEMFREWFEVDKGSMVLDLCEWELEQDADHEGHDDEEAGDEDAGDDDESNGKPAPESKD